MRSSYILLLNLCKKKQKCDTIVRIWKLAAKAFAYIIPIPSLQHLYTDSFVTAASQEVLRTNELFQVLHQTISKLRKLFRYRSIGLNNTQESSDVKTKLH